MQFSFTQLGFFNGGSKEDRSLKFAVRFAFEFMPSGLSALPLAGDGLAFPPKLSLVFGDLITDDPLLRKRFCLLPSPLNSLLGALLLLLSASLQFGRLSLGMVFVS